MNHMNRLRICCVSMGAVLLSGVLPLAQAQVPNALAAPAKSPSFVIKGFDIVGENPLSQSEVSRLLAPYLRVDATLETLQKATQTLEAALKDHGYVLHRVALPPQEVGDKVTLNVVKFVIGKVTIEGRQNYSEANIRSSLPELNVGGSPNFQTLAIQTAIANESQGKQVQVSMKESDEPDKIDARIIVKEAKPWYFNAGVSNTGSQATGNDRLTVSAGHANVGDADHALTLAWTTSLERSSNVRQGGLNYRIPLYRQGGVVALNYTQSDVVGDFGAFKSTGAGQTMGVSYSHYLAPQGGSRSYVTFGIDDKQFNVTQINGVPLAGQLLRRSVPVSLGYTRRVESDTSVWGFNVDGVLNAPTGTGNDLIAYRTEDTRISNVNWSALRGGFNLVTGLGRGWLWGLRSQLQISPDALISGEQFGIGGASSVRGVGERPISGDRGMSLNLEITTPEWTTGLRGLVFADGGWLSNNNPSATKLASDKLASVGIGLRYVLSNLSITADYGRITLGSEVPASTGLTVPRSGDDRLHVNLTARF